MTLFGITLWRLFLILSVLLVSASGKVYSHEPDKQPAGAVAKDDEAQDIIVLERERAATLDKLIDQLYGSAYDAYLEGDYERSIVRFETAQALNADRMQFWHKLALSYAYIATGRYPQGESLAKRLIQERPLHWKAYWHAGLAALWQKKMKEAQRFLALADDFEDHEPVVNVYLGMVYELTGQSKLAKLAQKQFLAAEQSYQAIISNNPEDEQACIELAHALLYQGKQLGRALELIEKAETLILNSDALEKKQIWLDFYLPQLKGIHLYRKKSYHESILALTEALRKAPSGARLDVAESYYYIGKGYQGLNNAPKARTFFLKALDVDPLILYAKEMNTFLSKP